MAELRYDKFFTISYCDSREGGGWGERWKSLAKVDMGVPLLQDSQSDTVFLYPVMGWNEGMRVGGAGTESPNDLTSPKPGLTTVSLKADHCPIGKFYEAYTAAENNLVNWKLFFFRTIYPADQNRKEEAHHFFTVTGIAGRIVGIEQYYQAGGEMSQIHLILSPNRISWYDHDTKTGGKVGWDAPQAGRGSKAMPESPI